LCAELCGPRWRLSRDEALDSTRAWVEQVLFHPRDRDGNLVLPLAPGVTPRDTVREWLELQGWPPHLLEVEYRKVMESQHAANPPAAAQPDAR
jgi:hypothetical protein